MKTAKLFLLCALTILAMLQSKASNPNPETDLEITLVPIHVSCPGASDGSIGTGIANGFPPFTFTWSNGSTMPFLFNISGGTYSVTVVDYFGQSGVGTTTVIEPPAFTHEVVNITPDCGFQDGAIDITVNGGSPPYQFDWDNDGVGDDDDPEDLTGLSSGTYNLTITDAGLCNYSLSVFVPGSSLIEITGVTTDPSCDNPSGGMIDITVSGGQSPYTYDWDDDGIGDDDDPEDRVNLNAGQYNVVARDANGCADLATFELATASSITLEGDFQPVSCANAMDGTAGVIVTGASPPFTYDWDNDGVGDNDDSSTITNLNGGIYTVIVTDATGCSGSISVEVPEPSILNQTAEITNAGCEGFNFGSITVDVSGGTVPYLFDWDIDGLGDQDDFESINNLAPGMYTLIVIDGNMCNDTVTYEVTGFPNPTVELDITNITCNNDNDGVIAAWPAGGTSPYLFEWSTGDTSSSINNLSPGNYFVTVSDAQGCQTLDTALVREPDPIEGQGDITFVNCFGGNDGSIELMTEGGTPPYSYEWSNGPTTSTNSQLEAGNYIVDITDTAGCVVVEVYEVLEPDEITIEAMTSNPACAGNATGQINLNVSGGDFFYTYAWSNGATSDSLSNIPAGNYSVTVTDGSDCSKTLENIIVEEGIPFSTSLEFELIDTIPDCSMYKVIATTTGGQAPYEYEWSNGGDEESNVNVMAAGTTLDVTVSDFNFCITSDTITTPDTLSLTPWVTNVDCAGNGNGAILIEPFNDTPDYQFIWSTGDTLSSIAGLAPGSYSVTVFDHLGCITSEENIQVTEPDLLFVEESILNPKCFGEFDGLIDLQTTGGVEPYSFAWSSSTNTSSTLQGIAAGTYSYTVTDANECMASDEVTLTQPDSISLQIEVMDIVCNGQFNGSISVTPSGGTAPYTYFWPALDSTTNVVTELFGGSYEVIITDHNNCQESLFIPVDEPDALTIDPFIFVQNDTCFLEFLIEGGIIDASGYFWELKTDEPNPTIFAQGNGIGNVQVALDTDINYTLTARDFNNCMTSNFISGEGCMTSVSDLLNPSSIQVYPNPSSGEFHINAIVPIKNWTLFSPQGEIFKTSTNISTHNLNLEIKDSPNGIYILQAHTTSGIWIEKLVKVE